MYWFWGLTHMYFTLMWWDLFLYLWFLSEFFSWWKRSSLIFCTYFIVSRFIGFACYFQKFFNWFSCVFEECNDNYTNSGKGAFSFRILMLFLNCLLCLSVQDLLSDTYFTIKQDISYWLCVYIYVINSIWLLKKIWMLCFLETSQDYHMISCDSLIWRDTILDFLILYCAYLPGINPIWINF